MSDNIVISFSNKDRAFVEALSELLNQRLSRYRTVRGDEAGDGRPRVWIYPQQTDGSRHIIEIHRQIEQALAVIVVLSDHSAASRWVLEEVQFAWNRNKFLIPIALGDRRAIRQSDPGVILETRTWNYADEADSVVVADSIIKTLEEEKFIRPAEIGSRYRHRRQLTTRPTGGYFEATRDDDERLFVVKEVADSDREMLRELDAKVAQLRQLRNPALPLIEDYLQEEGRRYIVWEEVPGRHLGDVLAAQKDQPLLWSDIQPWVADALTTLAFLHQAKVLHLGLKPQNLKRTREGQIKLLDIGLDRRAAGASATGTTDPYLAPELLDERDPSPRSDLYAFGALLYTLLTGDTQPSPLKPPVARRNRAVPEHVSQAIARAMSAEPAQRFRSANEFLVALEGAPAPIATAPQLPKWLLPAGGAVAALAAALFIGSMLIGIPGSAGGSNVAGGSTAATLPPEDACRGLMIGPWQPIESQGQMIELDSGDAYLLASVWSPAGQLKAGFDEVTIVLPPQTKTVLFHVAGVAWRYTGDCSSDYVNEQATQHQERIRTAGRTIAGINLDELPGWVLTPNVAVGATSAPSPMPASFDSVMALLGRGNELGRVVTEITEPINVRLEISGDYRGLTGWTGLQTSASDFVFHAQVQSGSFDDECSVYFHQDQSGNNSYVVGIQPSGLAFSQKKMNGNHENWKEQPTNALNTGTTARNSIVLTASGNTYSLYVNGILMDKVSFTDADFVEGSISLAAWSPSGTNPNGQPGCIFSDVWVWAPDAPAAAAIAPAPTARPLPASFDAVMALVRADPANAGAFDPQRGEIVAALAEPTTVVLRKEDKYLYGMVQLQGNLSDFVLYTEVAWGEKDDQCELNFRSGSNGRYVVGIKPDGSAYAFEYLSKSGGEEWNFLGNWFPSDLDTDLKKTNKVVYVVKGSKLLMYINGQLGLEITNFSHVQGGMWLSAYDNVGPNTEARPSCTFSDVWVWAPDGP